MNPNDARLLRSLRRLRPALNPTPAPPPTPLNPNPTNAFEIAIAERLKAMQNELDRVRGRLDWLLTVIVGAAMLNLLALLK